MSKLHVHELIFILYYVPIIPMGPILVYAGFCRGK